MISFRKLAILLPFLVFCSVPNADAEASRDPETPQSDAPVHRFDGFYTALEVGTQNVFGGALFDGIDILAQDTRAITELAVGWRKQLENRLVFGLELRYGILDGDLEQTFLDQIEIEYSNDQQLSYRLTLGWVLGKKRNLLLFGFFGETERRFDLRVQTPLGAFGQTDIQSFEQFGLGIERAFARRWGLRLTASTFDVDFGEKNTSLGINQDLTLSAGLTLRLGRLGEDGT